MKKQKKLSNLLLGFILLGGMLAISSCEKDEHKPPVIAFLTGGSYTSSDATVTDSVLVGVAVTKTEDELKTLNVSFGDQGGSNTTTYLNYSVTSSEQDGFSKDVMIPAPATSTSVQWTFTVTDRDGNVASKSLVLTHQ